MRPRVRASIGGTAGVTIRAPEKRTSEAVDRQDADDGDALFGGGGEVDLGTDPPVVVTRRVVEDLPHPPDLGFLVDEQARGAPGVGAGADLVVLGEVRVERGGPAGVGV